MMKERIVPEFVAEMQWKTATVSAVELMFLTATMFAGAQHL
jgi:hypothetical protein